MGAKLEKLTEDRDPDSSPEDRFTANLTTKEELDYDKMDTEEPTTSKYNGPVSYKKGQQDTTAESAEAENRLKSIMKRNQNAKHLHAVRFLEIPDVSEEPEEWDEKPTYLERWRIFCSKPVCKAIKAIVFYIVLPCCLIYVAIFFLSKLKARMVPVHTEKPFT